MQPLGDVPGQFREQLSAAIPRDELVYDARVDRRRPADEIVSSLRAGDRLAFIWGDGSDGWAVAVETASAPPAGAPLFPACGRAPWTVPVFASCEAKLASPRSTIAFTGIIAGQVRVGAHLVVHLVEAETTTGQALPFSNPVVRAGLSVPVRHVGKSYEVGDRVLVNGMRVTIAGHAWAPVLDPDAAGVRPLCNEHSCVPALQATFVQVRSAPSQGRSADDR